MPRFPIFIMLLWGLLAAAIGQTAEPGARGDASPRPNILWLIAEDMGPHLGCYGTPEVFTPHLDRLAAEGMRCTRAFATGPVCSASRSAFMTGAYQTTIGAHNHRSHRGDGYRLPEGTRLLTHLLRDLGYFTANLAEIEPGLRGTAKTDWNFSFEGKAFDSNRWQDLAAHQPFYAQINFSEAHRGGEWPESRKNNPRLADPRRVQLPPYYPDHAIARDDWANYLDTITQLDRRIGRVLEKLREEGLADRTVVVFFGDHGQCMPRGKQWCYDSGLRVPLIVRWPAGIPAPPEYRPGAVVEDLVSLLDVTATTLAMAGGEKPASMAGRVLLGPRAEPPAEYVFGARDRCDETVFRIRTVRDARYRYIRNFHPERPFFQLNRYKEASYPIIPLMRQLHRQGQLSPIQERFFDATRPAEELYDLAADPYEVHNLAGSPEHAEVLQRMRGVLEDWINRSNDQGRTPESPEIVRAVEKEMQRVYDAKIDRIWQKAGLGTFPAP